MLVVAFDGEEFAPVLGTAGFFLPTEVLPKGLVLLG